MMQTLPHGVPVHNIRFCKLSLSMIMIPFSHIFLDKFRFFLAMMLTLLFSYVLFQPGSPRSRSYEAPTPGSGWVNTPGGSYSDAGTPRDSSNLSYGVYTSIVRI